MTPLRHIKAAEAQDVREGDLIRLRIGNEDEPARWWIVDYIRNTGKYLRMIVKDGGRTETVRMAGPFEIKTDRPQESKHTPGPWSRSIIGDKKFIRYRGAYGPNICEMETGCPEFEANANLIAAAPEMLKALQTLYLDLQVQVEAEARQGKTAFAVRTDYMRANLRNAISAATGEDGQTVQETTEARAREICSTEGRTDV